MNPLIGFLIICGFTMIMAALVTALLFYVLDGKRAKVLNNLPSHPPELAEQPYPIPYIVDLPIDPPNADNMTDMEDMELVTAERIAAALARSEQKRKATLNLEIIKP